MKIKGFTLIELLVVIAIIGVLSSIVLSSLSTARDKAYYAAAQENLHTVELALELYRDDHGDWPNAGVAFSANTTNQADWLTFLGYLKPYMPTSAFEASQGTYNNGFYHLANAYIKATTADPHYFPVNDSVTGALVACVILRNGYFIDFELPQNSVTKNDGGVDPDGLDHLEGDYTLTLNPSHCP